MSISDDEAEQFIQELEHGKEMLTVIQHLVMNIQDGVIDEDTYLAALDNLEQHGADMPLP